MRSYCYRNGVSLPRIAGAMAMSWTPSITATASAAPLSLATTRGISTATICASSRWPSRQSRWDRVTFADGSRMNYTDAQEYLRCIQEELPQHPVTGFRYETLTDDPAVRKQVDDILFDLYGEENPQSLADYENGSDRDMKMGGM